MARAPHEVRTMNAALELRGIEKRFGATRVLRGVDLRVEKVERHALIGPNGAGKSTLFDLVSGRARSDEGRIVADGTDINGQPPPRVSRVLARSFQTTSVFGALSVLDNLHCAMLGAASSRYIDRWLPSRKTNERAQALLDAIGLAAHADEPAARLAYAEQRALDLGIALATDTPLILLDEPTAGMNRAEASRALALIRATTESRALLVIEHDMDAVFGLADRISMLAQVAACLAALRERGIAMLLIEERLTIARMLDARVAVMGQGAIRFDGAMETLRQDAAVTRQWLSVGGSADSG
ncbi:Branched-chain amino acid transport ATP-binding protein LivG (TC 3.A.1.4.1) [Candidatus Paraburkholderia kirkii UZHbot1]|uniref:Branched-chain amino acid transport ATP-binding protein LivG (TC 3.A.1.4.1) n=1 Tax=Candidatus Paraburkholderia kirkii UZHbot1 TaxID=1055526 RepID=G4MCA7_9BURK|nr:Branched-chain amino acid transport ATP-binding protein LivG (TC 3.A.1.4.1) [Candidatus Paraburkholderia kirkii UZHbot1]